MGNNYSEYEGRYLDHDDVQHDVLNGNLTESSLYPGTYEDGDGNCYDSEYNPIQ